MPDVSDLLGGRYLAAQNIPEPLKVTIVGAERAEIEEDDKSLVTKLVVHFQELQKPLLCNKTNLNMLVHLHGRDSDEWIGKQVIIQSEPVEFAGKIVEALRVKPANKAAAPAGRPGKPDEVPF
jgi:hypothetical protein